MKRVCLWLLFTAVCFIFLDVWFVFSKDMNVACFFFVRITDVDDIKTVLSLFKFLSHYFVTC